MLEAQLTALGAKPADEYPEWATGLRRQQIEIILLLVKAHPRWVTDEYLMNNISHRDPVCDLDIENVKTPICGIRKAFGHDHIENQWGGLYRAGSPLVCLVNGALIAAA